MSKAENLIRDLHFANFFKNAPLTTGSHCQRCLKVSLNKLQYPSKQSQAYINNAHTNQAGFVRRERERETEMVEAVIKIRYASSVYQGFE